MVTSNKPRARSKTLWRARTRQSVVGGLVCALVKPFLIDMHRVKRAPICVDVFSRKVDALDLVCWRQLERDGVAVAADGFRLQQSLHHTEGDAYSRLDLPQLPSLGCRQSLDPLEQLFHVDHLRSDLPLR